MENSASVQAMLADIFVEKCGHFAVKQKLPKKCHILVKFKTIEEDFEKRIKDVEKAIKQEQRKNKNLQVEFQTLEIESDIIKCKYCEFSTNSAEKKAHC